MKVNVKIKRLSEDAVEDVIIEPGETKIVPTGLAIGLPPNYEAQIRPRSGITVKTKLRVQLGTIDAGYNGEIGIIVDNISQIETEVNERYDYNYEDELEFDGVDVTTPSDYRVRTIGKTLYETPNQYPLGTYIIRKGDRLAQCVINQVEQAQFTVVEELDETERGNGGFGSSGVTSG